MEGVSRISPSYDHPDLVFIDEVPKGFRIAEIFYGKTASGQITRRNKERVHVVSPDNLEAVLKRYDSSTTVFMGEGDLQ